MTVPYRHRSARRALALLHAQNWSASDSASESDASIFHDAESNADHFCACSSASTILADLTMLSCFYCNVTSQLYSAVPCDACIRLNSPLPRLSL